MTLAFTAGHQVRLLESGTAYFPALLREIQLATSDIHLETYLFENDATGQLIAEALIQASIRGVLVHVLVDGFGAVKFPRQFMPRLQENGVEVLIYRREVRPFSLHRYRLRRMHRKIVVIDKRIAFVGGINIIDDLSLVDALPGQPIAPRYDYAVRIEGPILRDIYASVYSLWTRVSWASFKRRSLKSKHSDAHHPVVCDAKGSIELAFLIRDNLGHRHDIEDAYLEAIRSARHEIVIACAYFLPGMRFRHALIAAAKRGVKVVILLQGRAEYFLLHYATQALYDSFLRAGIQLFEYHKSFLHAKVAVIDNDWATVGSSNIDPFSLLLAREANVVVRDAAFATQLRQSLYAAMRTGASQLRYDDWQKKAFFRRVAHWFAYSLVRVMISCL